MARQFETVLDKDDPDPLAHVGEGELASAVLIARVGDADATETHLLARSHLCHDVESAGGQHGEHRVAGSHSTASVQHEQLVVGRHLDGADRYTAREHLAGLLAVRGRARQTLFRYIPH